MKAAYKYSVCGTVAMVLVVASLVLSNDPISRKLRSSFEHTVNGYIKNLTQRASSNSLTSIDKIVVRTSIFAGISISRIYYPEAAELLQHYIHGEGKDLRLNSGYFESSEYLDQVISQKGLGNHGPIALRQDQDWRLSLALNPYYLEVSEQKIRIYHPKIEFADVDGELVYTVVPLGRIRLKVYDNLVSALDVSPFYVYAEWSK